MKGWTTKLLGHVLDTVAESSAPGAYHYVCRNCARTWQRLGMVACECDHGERRKSWRVCDADSE